MDYSFLLRNRCPRNVPLVQIPPFFFALFSLPPTVVVLAATGFLSTLDLVVVRPSSSDCGSVGCSMRYSSLRLVFASLMMSTILARRSTFLLFLPPLPLDAVCFRQSCASVSALCDCFLYVSLRLLHTNALERLRWCNELLRFLGHNRLLRLPRFLFLASLFRRAVAAVCDAAEDRSTRGGCAFLSTSSRALLRLPTLLGWRFCD